MIFTGIFMRRFFTQSNSTHSNIGRVRYLFAYVFYMCLLLNDHLHDHKHVMHMWEIKVCKIQLFSNCFPTFGHIDVELLTINAPIFDIVFRGWHWNQR